MNKKYLLLMSLFTALMLFFGCNAEPQVKTLKIWDTMGPDELVTLQSIVDDFQKLHPDCNIEIEKVPFADAQDKFELAVNAGQGPDLFRCEIAWTPLYADLGMLLPLEDKVEDELLDDFLAVPLAYNYYQDQLWGLPEVTDCLALMYNKKLFKQAKKAIPALKSPDQWADYNEFTASSVLLNQWMKKQNPDSWAMFLRGDPYFVQPFVWAFGGELIGEGKSILIDSKESMDGIRAFMKLKDELKLAPAEIDFTNDYDNALRGFKAGRIAMILNGPWATSDILSGEAFDHSKGGNPADFGIASFPKKVRSGSPVGGHNYVLPKNCKDPDLAMEFLLFLVKPENQVRFTLNNNLLPTRQSSYDMLEAMSEDEFPNKALVMAFKNQLDQANVRPVIPEGGKIYKDFTVHFQKIFSGDLSVEEGMHRVAADWKKILNED